jgi:xylulokinase
VTSSADVYLGIDLGTSELKLALLDEGHRLIAGVGEPIVTSRPHPLWSEQDPANWWAALDAAMLRMRASHPAAMARVRAIGPSGQMHGAVLLDRNGTVLRPAILWNDGRSRPQCASLEKALPELWSVAGNGAMPGFTAPKLLWMREHEPGVFERVAHVLLPKDWLRLELTGERVSDMSDASGTLWLDVGGRCWSDALLAAGGMTRAQMPRLVEGTAVSGQLRPAWARRWGLRSGLPVAGGGGDNAASAIGVGAVGPNQGFISLGTSGVVFLAGDRFRPNPGAAVHAFCHALPRRWHEMSVMLSAASALRWVCGVLALSEAALLDRVATLSPAQRAHAPLFLPYLSGERTPHNDAGAQGVLFGLSHDHDVATLGYAVIEGVSFGLLDGWKSLSAERNSVASLSLIGGGARSDLWVQLLASLFGIAMCTHQHGATGGALGAARLAWLADGGDEREVCRVPPVTREFDPAAGETPLFIARYERFRALYPALRDQFGSPDKEQAS